MAESEKKSLIDFEWDLFDDESPETEVAPPADLAGELPEKTLKPQAEDDDWP